MNVSYGSDAAQKMDIYLPAGRKESSTKVMILIHGGGWTTGDKSEFDSYIASFKLRLPDYAFFNINYRLYNTGTGAFKFPTQENDVKAALDFIFSRSGEYKISNKFALLGASAGAHLALLQAYKHTSGMKAKAVISLFGPTDMVEFYNNPPTPFLQPSLVALLGATPTQNLAIYQQSSPAFFVNSGSMPTLLLHGSNDPLVPISQSTLLKNKLEANGIFVQMVTYPEGHGWGGASLEDSFNKIISFLASQVQ